MRTGTVLFLLAAAAVTATVTGPVAAGDEVLGGGADTWPGHAVSDEDVARAGRAAMPFTAGADRGPGPSAAGDAAAASVAADPVPQGRVRRVRIRRPRRGRDPHDRVCAGAT